MKAGCDDQIVEIKFTYIFHNRKCGVYNSRILMFTGNLECQSCSDCVQRIGQCHLIKIESTRINRNVRSMFACNFFVKPIKILTAVTPAPAPAMNLSEFFMNLLTGIIAPTYCKINQLKLFFFFHNHM